MKVMISQPMSGIPDEQVIKTQEVLKEKFARLHIEVIDSFINDPCPDDCNHPGVFYLGRTIMEKMHTVDAVYFVEGWEKARGCRIERKICEEYNIKILDERFFDNRKLESIVFRDNPIIAPYPNLSSPNILPTRSIDPSIDPIAPYKITCNNDVFRTCTNGRHFKKEDSIVANTAEEVKLKDYPVGLDNIKDLQDPFLNNHIPRID